MKKIFNIIKKILIFLILIVLSIGICVQSELSPISNKIPSTDSDVYIYISELLHRGKTVYTDVFDHKGPVFHLIEYIGVSIPLNNYIGLWLIELLCMIITLAFLFKTANLICKNKLISLLTIVIAIMPFSRFFINGNYPEEYALPFIAISLYYMARYLLGIKELGKKQYVIIGVCMSMVLLIKLNLISVWIVFGLSIFIKMIRDKKIKDIKMAILYLLIGILIILLPTIIVLIIQGNFVDFIKQYIFFNYKYSSVKNGFSDSVIPIFVTKTFYVSIIACVVDMLIRIICQKNGKTLTSTAFIYLIITMLIIIMPCNDFYHYGMVLIPTYIIPISLLLTDFLDVLYVRKNYFKIFLTTIIFVIYSFLFISEEVSIYRKNMILVAGKQFEYRQSPVTNYIKENTTKDDDMLVLGNECNLYLMAERISNCKYIYQIPIIRVDNKILDETMQEIKEKKPKIIVLCKTRYTEIEDNFYEYLSKYDVYDMVFVYGRYEVYKLK